MATVVQTTDLIFGMGYPHNLPNGWRLIESPKEWARATDPRGNLYFLAKSGAYPERTLTEDKGRLKKGDIFADLENPIRFTNKK